MFLRHFDNVNLEMKMKKKLYLLLLPVSGIMTGLCVSYVAPAMLEWFTIAPFLAVLFLCARDKLAPKRGFLLGFAYFYPYYLTVWHWFLLMYPLDFTGLSPSVAFTVVVVSWLGLPLLQTVIAMLQVPLFLMATKSKFAKPLIYPVIFGGTYILFEWIQTLTWAGVPWGRLAIGQAYVPIFVRSASLFGSYFVSFVIIAVNGYAALAALLAIKRKYVKTLVSIGLACAIFAVNLTLGGVVSLTHTPDSKDDAVSVGALQGNISSADKWSDKGFDNVSAVYKRLTEAAVSDGADIVVWTETSMPYNVSGNTFMQRYLENLAAVNDATIFATAFWSERDGDDVGETYNVVLNVSPTSGVDTECIYKKQRLVPFGEFVPFEDFVKKLVPGLASLNMFSSAVSPGDGAYVAETKHGKVGNLICFDSIYEEYSLNAVRDGAELLTVSTNDSWFGQSAALFQHTAQSVLRAIETDRYVVRAANTGCTCIIAPTGEVVSSIPIDEENYIVSEVCMRSTRTLYSVVGNAVVWISFAGLLFLCVDAAVTTVKRKKSKKTEYSFRTADAFDIDELVKIYDDGRRAIASLGIDQWQDGYPSREVIETDIEQHALYVAVSDGKIASAAAFLPPPEPDYGEIEGDWLTDTDNYAVIHRVTSSEAYRGRGAASALVRELLKLAASDGRECVRADTHRGNVAMQSFLERHGFERCGIVTLSHGDGDRVRVAYEHVIRK